MKAASRYDVLEYRLRSAGFERTGGSQLFSRGVPMTVYSLESWEHKDGRVCLVAASEQPEMFLPVETEAEALRFIASPRG